MTKLKMRSIDAAVVRILLFKACEAYGSQSAVAREAGVSAGFLSDVLLGRRDPSGPLLAFLGLRKVVRYEKEKK